VEKVRPGEDWKIISLENNIIPLRKTGGN